MNHPHFAFTFRLFFLLVTDCRANRMELLCSSHPCLIGRLIIEEDLCLLTLLLTAPIRLAVIASAFQWNAI